MNPPIILEVPCWGCDEPILIVDSGGARTFKHKFQNERCEIAWGATIEVLEASIEAI